MGIRERKPRIGLNEMPHDGYSVEYLQAIVKSAKIYIRHLHRNLDTSPIVKEVS